MRLLALDLSLTSTGYAFLNDEPFRHEAKAIVPPKGLKEGVRLLWFWRKIDEITPCKYNMVIIEDLPKHAMAAGVTGQLHGAIKAFMEADGWPAPVLVPPATVKVMATGKGNADKTAMVIAARDRLGYDGQQNDVADALWLEQIALHLVNHPNAVTLPKTHLRALDKLVVPS